MSARKDIAYTLLTYLTITGLSFVYKTTLLNEKIDCVDLQLFHLVIGLIPSYKTR